MTEKTINTWGPIGVLSVIVGIVSWFVGGIYCSLIVGFAAVALGFIGVKKKQRLSLVGMLFGGFTLMFVNLINLGIIPIPSTLASDKSHLINSINASIRAYEVLGNKPYEDTDKVRMITHLKRGLEEAQMIDINKVDEEVPGFASHYQGEFIIGVESLIEGYEKSDISKKLEGGRLLSKWGKWNTENRRNLGRIKESIPPLISFLRAIRAH